MNLTQLRALVADLIVLNRNLVQAVEANQRFLERAASDMSPDNPFLSLLFPNENDVSSYVNIQVPVYNDNLTDIETAADAMGTDPFH